MPVCMLDVCSGKFCR